MFIEPNMLLNEFKDAFKKMLDEIEVLETTLPIKKTKHDDNPGVYVIYSKNESLAYVGMSTRTMGDEIWANVNNVYNPYKEVSWKKYPNRKPLPYAVQTFAMSKTTRYFAPALELFIIEKLNDKGIELLNIRK